MGFRSNFQDSLIGLRHFSNEARPMQHQLYVTFFGCALAVDHEESLTVSAHTVQRPIASQSQVALEELRWRGRMPGTAKSKGNGHHPTIARHIK